eukprot:414937-Hanusia_phi.AAC.7
MAMPANTAATTEKEAMRSLNCEDIRVSAGKLRLRITAEQVRQGEGGWARQGDTRGNEKEGTRPDKNELPGSGGGEDLGISQFASW